MLRLPESPRARRRLAWVGAAAGVAVVAVGAIALIPNKAPTAHESIPNEGPAQLAAAPVTHISRAEHEAIDRTLDRFIPAAMERKDATLAWSLAGPDLKSGATVAEWRRGDSSVPYYEPRETSFHVWDVIDAGRDYVVFNLIVHPRPGFKLATYVLSGQVVKQHGQWLVNRLYPISIENPVTRTTHEIGPADFAAPSSRGPADVGHTRPKWIIPGLVLFSLVLLVPLVLGAGALVRARRWKQQVRASGRTELPPLPSSYRRESTEASQKLVRH
jgi:hypothetical protein